MGLKSFFDKAADFISDIPIVGDVFDIMRENPRTTLLLAAGIGGIAAMGGFSGLLGAGGAAGEAGATAAVEGASQAAMLAEQTGAFGAAGEAATAEALGSASTAAPSFLSQAASGAGKLGQFMFGTPTRTMVTGQLLQGAGSYLSAQQAAEEERKRYEQEMELRRQQMAMRKVNIVGSTPFAGYRPSAGPIGASMQPRSSVSMSPSEALQLRRTGQL